MKQFHPIRTFTARTFLSISAVFLMMLSRPAYAEDPTKHLPGKCQGPACEFVKLKRGDNEGCLYAVNTGENAVTVRAEEKGMPLSHVVKPGEEVEIQVQSGRHGIPSVCAEIDPVKPFAYKTDRLIEGRCTGDGCEDVKLTRGPNRKCYYAFNTGEILSSIELPPEDPKRRPLFLKAGEKALLKDREGICVPVNGAEKPAYIAKRQKADTDWEFVRINKKLYQYSWVRRAYRPRFDIDRVGGVETAAQRHFSAVCGNAGRTKGPRGRQVCLIGDTPLKKKIRAVKLQVCRTSLSWSRNETTLFARDAQIRAFEAAIKELRATPEDSPLRAVIKCSSRRQDEQLSQELRDRFEKRRTRLSRSRTRRPAKRNGKTKPPAREQDEESAKEGKRLAVGKKATKEKETQQQAALQKPKAPNKAKPPGPWPKAKIDKTLKVALGLLNNKQYKDVVLQLAPLVERHPDNLSARAIRWRAHIELGDYQRAESDLTKVLKTHPGRADLLSLRASLRHKRKNYRGAADDLSKVIDAGKADWVVWFRRGLAYKGLNDNNNAIGDLHEAFNIVKAGKVDKRKARDAEFKIRFERAHSFLQLKMYKKAIEDFDVTIDMQPDNSRLYYLRGNALAYAGQLDAALKDADKVLRIEPDFKPAQNLRAGIKAAQKKKN